MKNFLSLILIIFFSNLSYAQSSISSARLQPLGSTVTVTGVESTVETGQLIAQGWAEVDAYTDDTWTEV